MSPTSTFSAADGEGYELQMGRWSRRLAPLFLQFSGTRGAVEVLDVGCGTGSVGLCLVEDRDVISVRGLDISAPYVAFASCRNRDPRLTFQVGDACDLPFPDASFDHTVSMLSLQFVPQSSVALREMRRVTRPGGTVAATTWDTRGGFVTMRMVYDAAALLVAKGQEARSKAYTRPMTRPGDLARLWLDAELMHVEQTMLTIRMDFASFADFWAPHEGRDGPVAAYLSTLEPAEKVQLRNAVRLAYLDGDVDGPRSYAATAWAVRGKVPSPC